jgi:hypothetical protein
MFEGAVCICVCVCVCTGEVGAVQCCVVGAAVLLCTRILLYPYTILPFCPVDFCVSSSFGLADQLSCGAFCFTKCRLQIIFLFHGKF